jgi:hypothetical protein
VRNEWVFSIFPFLPIYYQLKEVVNDVSYELSLNSVVIYLQYNTQRDEKKKPKLCTVEINRINTPRNKLFRSKIFGNSIVVVVVDGVCSCGYENEWNAYACACLE